jgi:hypothetical protein
MEQEIDGRTMHRNRIAFDRRSLAIRPRQLTRDASRFWHLFLPALAPDGVTGIRQMTAQLDAASW